LGSRECHVIARESILIELVRRTFDVDASVEGAWAHLARVESWPSWAKHIKRVTLTPPGMLTGASEGQFRLKGGARSTFVVEEFDPPRRWRWAGRFLSARVHYDHLFEDVSGRARLTWIVEAEGFGARSLGRVFGAIYARNLDRAIPNLQAELRATC
jgi:Polyketide cyclase / dehydrase and lipid transport